jgi:uncharacterized protein (DUF1330 family)
MQRTDPPAYAVGHLRNVVMGPAIAEYVARIDATLEPFGGRFLIHGARPDVLEGDWDGDLIVIAFPDLDAARAWYRSDAYRAIIPLRAENSDGDILLFEGVPHGHRATDIFDEGVSPGIANSTA